jgi:hypothetical protein
MAEDLELKSRDEVIDTAAKHIFDVEQGAAVEVDIELAYVRAGYDFIPAAIVTFEDELLSEVIIIPIVDIPPDKDLDGIEDTKDNCDDKSNPEQLDRDQDGVGDKCDNCPDVSNPKQDDSNGDHIGDACEPDEKEDEQE